MDIDKRILDFIKEHHVLTLATSVDDKPYACNCFYVYDEQTNVFIFSSDEGTKHINDININNLVGGSIVLETSIIGKIQGIQFTGSMYKSENEDLKHYKKLYLKRFPFAVLTNTLLWFVEIDFLKMTDNRLGFGKKLIWGKNE